MTSATRWNCLSCCFRIAAKTRIGMERFIDVCSVVCWWTARTQLSRLGVVWEKRSEDGCTTARPRGGLCEPGYGFLCWPWLWTVPSLRCNCRIFLQCAQVPLALLEDWENSLDCNMLNGNVWNGHEVTEGDSIYIYMFDRPRPANAKPLPGQAGHDSLVNMLHVAPTE